MASSSGCVREEVARSLLDVAERVASVSRSEAPQTDQRFPRNCRLTARRQFLEVYKRGHKVRRPSFTVFGLANDVGRCRIGLTVTRKIGGAVIRNRIKRVLREAFRRHEMKLQRPMDLVFNAQRALSSMSADQIEREIRDAIAELGRVIR